MAMAAAREQQEQIKWSPVCLLHDLGLLPAQENGSYASPQVSCSGSAMPAVAV